MRMPRPQVHILGHQPPVFPGYDDVGAATTAWVPGLWPKFANMLGKYNGTVKAVMLGHTHIDFLALIRECRSSGPGAPYIETTGIKWCSGGEYKSLFVHSRPACIVC